MSVKPSLEALKLAATFTLEGEKLTPFEVIGIAGAFDAYLAGMIEVVPIKLTSDDFQVTVQLKSGGGPEEERPRMAEDAGDDNGCGYTISPDLGEADA